MNFDDQQQQRRPDDSNPFGKKEDSSSGPITPKTGKPPTKDLLERMRKIEPERARRYRQRSGQ
jgi:hypothetical protein